MDEELKKKLDESYNNIYYLFEKFLNDTDEDIDIVCEIIYDLDNKDYKELSLIYMLIYHFCERHKDDYNFKIDFN